jgi:hypothetical protein
MRSNVDYVLYVQASGISDRGADCVAGSTARVISTREIRFGVRRRFTAGAGVVRPRYDTIFEKFRLAKWPVARSSDGHGARFSATLEDISAAATPILAGTRISAGGDNSSDDNFIELELLVALLPRIRMPLPFSGTVTLTIGPRHP